MARLTPEEDPVRAELIADELVVLPAMELALAAPSVVHLAALIQLALRHPGVQATTRKVGEALLGGVRVYLENSPMALELVKAGDDPSQDVPAPRSRPAAATRRPS